jgi:hypothetical protein
MDSPYIKPVPSAFRHANFVPGRRLSRRDLIDNLIAAELKVAGLTSGSAIDIHTLLNFIYRIDSP